MTKLRCEIEREFSIVARRETKSVLHMTNTSGDNILKNWNPSHEDKFVTETRDQPEPGSFIPRSLWGGQMKDPGNVVDYSHTCQGTSALSKAALTSVFQQVVAGNQ